MIEAMVDPLASERTHKVGVVATLTYEAWVYVSPLINSQFCLIRYKIISAMESTNWDLKFGIVRLYELICDFNNLSFFFTYMEYVF
jgi:hypothetical protein